MAAAEKLTFIDIAKERLSLVENPQIIDGQTGETLQKMPGDIE